MKFSKLLKTRKQIMSKIDFHSHIIKKYMDSQNYDELKKYLIKESNLPGARINLELTKAFYFQITRDTLTDDLWATLIQYASLPTSTNEPETILPFCAIHSFGNSYLFCNQERQELILDKIQVAMNDVRWRIREAASDACQIIAEHDVTIIIKWFTELLPDSSLLEKRAIIASLAHPPILKSAEICKYCFEVSDTLFRYIAELSADTIKSDNYVVLKKGMDYAPSVFIQASPEMDFDILINAANFQKAHINKIVKSNLSKNRLKKYSEQISAISKLICRL